MEMKFGKIPDTIWQRSVLKQVKHRKAEVIQGIDPGVNAALLSTDTCQIMISSQNIFVCILPEDGENALHKTINYLLAEGAKPIGVHTSLLFPEGHKEEDLRNFIKKLDDVCENIGIEIISAKAEVAAAINRPILSLTGIGMRSSAGTVEKASIHPSCELVMTGWAGQEGTSVLAHVKKEQLLSRYTCEFLESAAELVDNISIKDQVEVAEENQINVMQPLNESGIFGALWELSGRYGLGFEVDLKKIPIHQDTIEICEFFDLNPYRLASAGCVLLVAEHGNELVEQLSDKGICAAVIGRMVKGKDKRILNEDETRFLEPPSEDELSKIYIK